MSYKCLFIDDDISICKTFGMLMPQFGIDLDAAYDAATALEKLNTSTYDLICFDWNLEHGTTQELAEIVAKRDILPLIVVHTSDEDGAVSLIKTFKGQCIHIRKTDLVMHINKIMVELGSR